MRYCFGKMSTRILTFTLRFIAVIQAILGALFLFAPEATAALFRFTVAPGWANWLFGEMSARFLAFAYGMWISARDPYVYRSWIFAMIAVQTIDWLVTAKYIFQGAITFAQVPTAVILPILFIIGLVVGFPRKSVTQ
jgi:hypothetical protein